MITGRKGASAIATSDLTKQAIANGLKSLMREKPFAAISVQELVRRCGISRNTFYYHFPDKYQVVRWIFFSEITPILSRGMEVKNWPENLLALCQYMQENRGFYLSALAVEGQNSFVECLMEFYESLVRSLLRSADRAGSLSAEDIDFVAHFYAYSLIGTVLEWARGGMNADPWPVIQRLKRLSSGELFKGVVLAVSGE